jgi:hypothetical protein
MDITYFDYIVTFAARLNLDVPIYSTFVRARHRGEAESFGWRKAWRKHPEWNRGTHRITNIRRQDLARKGA